MRFGYMNLDMLLALGRSQSSRDISSWHCIQFGQAVLASAHPLMPIRVLLPV